MRKIQSRLEFPAELDMSKYIVKLTAKQPAALERQHAQAKAPDASAAALPTTTPESSAPPTQPPQPQPVPHPPPELAATSPAGTPTSPFAARCSDNVGGRSVQRGGCASE
jgi:hypothetical protein